VTDNLQMRFDPENWSFTVSNLRYKQTF